MSRVAGGAVSIETRHIGQRAVLVLSGQLDYRSHRAFRAAYEPQFASATVDEVQLDLSAIEAIDSAALGLLLIFRERGLASRMRVSLIAKTGPIVERLEQ